LYLQAASSKKVLDEVGDNPHHVRQQRYAAECWHTPYGNVIAVCVLLMPTFAIATSSISGMGRQASLLLLPLLKALLAPPSCRSVVLYTAVNSRARREV
jgi:hypothetical protein